MLDARAAARLRLAQGRKPDRAWLCSQDIWNRPDQGEGRPQGLRGAVQGGVTGNKGDIQGGAAAPGLEGPSWWLSEDPGAAGPTVGAFVEANRKHQNENKLHHTVCLRELPVTVCRPDPKETAPTQVPLRPLVPCGWILHLGVSLCGSARQEPPTQLSLFLGSQPCSTCSGPIPCTTP